MFEGLRRLGNRKLGSYRRPGVIELSRETAREAVYAMVLTIARNPAGMTDPRRATCLAKAQDLLGRAVEEEGPPAGGVVDSAALARTAHLLHLAGDLCNEAANLDQPPLRTQSELAQNEFA